MTSFFENSTNISPCGRYLYAQSRLCNDEVRTCLFICLHPPMIDEMTDDEVTVRCKEFANFWGYGGIAIVNLFALRANGLPEIKQAIDPIGPENDGQIISHLLSPDLIVPAWGSNGAYRGRGAEILKKLEFIANETPKNVWHFGLTENKQPKHILDIKDKSALVRLRPKKRRTGVFKRLWEDSEFELGLAETKPIVNELSPSPVVKLIHFRPICNTLEESRKAVSLFSSKQLNEHIEKNLLIRDGYLRFQKIVHPFDVPDSLWETHLVEKNGMVIGYAAGAPE